MSSEWIAITSITHPEIVKKVHADFVKAGANFIIANTYNVNYNVLNSINKGDLCEELIENSMKLAREAMKEQKTAENDCFLAASISEHPPKCTRKENDQSRQNFPGWQDQKTVASNFEKTATLLLTLCARNPLCARKRRKVVFFLKILFFNIKKPSQKADILTSET